MGVRVRHYEVGVGAAGLQIIQSPAQHEPLLEFRICIHQYPSTQISPGGSVAMPNRMLANTVLLHRRCALIEEYSMDPDSILCTVLLSNLLSSHFIPHLSFDSTDGPDATIDQGSVHKSHACTSVQHLQCLLTIRNPSRCKYNLGLIDSSR